MNMVSYAQQQIRTSSAEIEDLLMQTAGDNASAMHLGLAVTFEGPYSLLPLAHVSVWA